MAFEETGPAFSIVSIDASATMIGTKTTAKARRLSHIEAPAFPIGV